MKKLKNSLELRNPTGNTRKFANKLMTDTSGEINLQSKQDIICHVAKVKPTTSAHSFDKARKMSYIHSKEKVIIWASTFTFLVCKQSLLIH